MKKTIALIMSVLMLVSLLPFSAISAAAASTNAYASEFDDGSYYMMKVPKALTSVKYGKGLGWSSDRLWRNSTDTAYTNSQGAAYAHTREVNGEYFFNFTFNTKYTYSTGCTNLSMDHDLLTTGSSTEVGIDSSIPKDKLTHMAFRVKVFGGEADQVSILGILADKMYFQSNTSNVYLIDNATGAVVDPEWTGSTGFIFKGEFDGWIVMPFNTFGGKTITYPLYDEDGNPVYELYDNGETIRDEEGNPIQKTANHKISAKDMLLGTGVDQNGDPMITSSLQFWFHGDDETNNDGTGNEGCSHWIQNTSWDNRSFYMGDFVVIEDLDKFNYVHTKCSTEGHTYTEGEYVEVTCEEPGYTPFTCTRCGYLHKEIKVEALGHKYTMEKVAASCEEVGGDKYTCSVCSDVKWENTTPEIGHNYIKTRVPATETERACDLYTCSRCHDFYKENFGTALGEPDDILRMSFYHFSSWADNYTTDGVNTNADKLEEIEDVLAEGYVNTLFMGTGDGFEERVALCRKYNCKFWMGAGKFDSSKQSIENYVNNIAVNVEKIIAADAWDLFLGFHWDEPVWGGQSKEDFYTMTKALYEKWGKRNYPVFATGVFLDEYVADCDKIAPEYTTYVTDAGWDSYSWDVRDSMLGNAGQKSQLLKHNNVYHPTGKDECQSGKDVYRCIQKRLESKFDHEVNYWFYPSGYENYLWTQTSADEDYCLAHLEFFTELLLELENPGGISIYTYAKFGENGTDSLEQNLPIKNLATGEQKLYPEHEKWETYAKRLKELKTQFDNTPIYFKVNLPFGSLDVYELNDTSFKYRPLDGYRYSIDGGKTYQTSGEFTNLTPETAYTVRVLRSADGEYKEFVVKTKATEPYDSGRDDGATYIIKMPQNIERLTNTYGWIATANSRNIDDTDFTGNNNGSVFLKTIDGERFLEVKNSGGDAPSSIIITFGDDYRANSVKGLHDRIGGEGFEAFAFRIKTTGGTDDQISKFDFYINQSRTYRTSTYPLSFIDYKTGEVSSMPFENGIKIVGNVDGWLIVPVEAYSDLDGKSSTTNEQWCMENFSGFQFWQHYHGCGHAATGSSWDDKLWYIGDMFALENVDKFIKRHGAPEGVTIKSYCADRIEVDATEGMLYSIDGENWTKEALFTGLSASTTYTVYAKYEGAYASATTTVTTKASHNLRGYVTRPTCTEQGYTQYICSLCGYSYKANIRPATGHSLTTEEKAATCTENGYKKETCSTCGYSSEVVYPASHDYQEIVTYPTCTEQGYTEYICFICGDNYKDNYEDALGHQYIEVVTPPTTTSEGYTEHICTECGDTYIDNIVPALHNYEEFVTEPTCTEKGYTEYVCFDCGDSYISDWVDALGHQYIEIVTPPTTTSEGYTEHICTECGDTYIDNIVPATHNYEGMVTEPTCTEKGFTEYICFDCGDSYIGDWVDALGHAYKDTVVPPTETAQGYTEHKCTRCGDSYKDNYTAPVVNTKKISGVKATASDVDITVTWNARADAIVYYVRIMNEDGTTISTKTVSDGSTSYVFSGLEFDVNYKFIVYAKLADKTFLKAADADVVSAHLVLGDRVVGIKSSVKGRTITVSWMAFPGADRYYVMVYPKGADPTVNANRVTTVNAGNKTTVDIINAIAPETDYEIYVSARVNGKYQSLENALYTSAIIPVTAPSSFEVTSIEPTIVRIKWNAVKNADRYWARIVDENGNTVKTRECAKALVSFTGLTPGKTYYVQLQARVPKSSGGNQYSGYCDPILTQPVTLPLK